MAISAVTKMCKYQEAVIDEIRMRVDVVLGPCGVPVPVQKIIAGYAPASICMAVSDLSDRDKTADMAMEHLKRTGRMKIAKYQEFTIQYAHGGSSQVDLRWCSNNEIIDIFASSSWYLGETVYGDLQKAYEQLLYKAHVCFHSIVVNYPAHKDEKSYARVADLPDVNPEKAEGLLREIEEDLSNLIEKCLAHDPSLE